MLKSLKCLVTIILSLCVLTAHAELNDTTTIAIKSENNEDIVHTFTGNEVKWLVQPNIRVPSHLLVRLQTGQRYYLEVVANVDVEGYIVSANIATSSGNQRLDEHMIRELLHSRMMPYTIDTQPVVSKAIIPIIFNIPE